MIHVTNCYCVMLAGYSMNTSWRTMSRNNEGYHYKKKVLTELQRTIQDLKKSKN